jgi:hypothetical protein
MADISPTINRQIDPDNGTVIKATWNGLNSGNNVGVPVKMPQHVDRCVEMRGTFDGATVVLEGSNGGTAYATLTNPAGTALSFTAAGIKQVVEAPLYIRPNVTSNIGNNTAIVADLVMRRNNPYSK